MSIFEQLIQWSEDYVPNVAGVIAMAFATVIWVTSFQPIRRKMFEVFYYSHHFYILYIIFYLIHVGAAYVCLILPGIFLWAIDRNLRFLQSQRRVSLVSARHLPCGAVELNFLKSPGLVSSRADHWDSFYCFCLLPNIWLEFTLFLIRTML